MKQFIIASLFLLTATSIKAQSTTNDVLTIAEQMPTFPGGDKAMKEYLQKNVVYPKIEKEFGVSGMVYMTFVVTKDGSITDVKCLKPIKAGPGCNKEAIRVVSTMPKWKPGMQGGKAVSVQYALPVKFLLDNNKALTEEEMIAIANKHYKAGLALAQKKQYKEALEEFDYTVFCLPGDINALYQRGLAFHNLKDDKKACDEWNKIKFQDNTTADEMLSKYCK